MKQFSNTEATKTDGVVIGSLNYSEKDLILKVLTEDFGKISVFVRNAKNIKKNIPDLFDYGTFSVKFKSSSMAAFNSYQPLTRFKSFREDLNKLSILSVIAECHEKLLPEHEGNSKELFDALLITLTGLENSGDLKEQLKLLHLSLVSLLDNTGFGLEDKTRAPSLNNLLRVLARSEEQVSGEMLSFKVLKSEVLTKVTVQE